MLQNNVGHSEKLMGKMLTTKEVADFLNVHEKIVYALVSEKGLPATKVTGKWIFPQNLVEKWLWNNTTNVPYDDIALLSDKTLIITDSPDTLLEQLIGIYNRQNDGSLIAFGSTGSTEGLAALNNHLCHIAIAHDLEEEHTAKNKAAKHQFEAKPNTVRINFCKRELGFIMPKGHFTEVNSSDDIPWHNVKIANRSEGTSSSKLLEQELKKLDVNATKVNGYKDDDKTCLEAALKVKTGQADLTIGSHAVAQLLDLVFLPLKWERYDFVIEQNSFFGREIQRFLALLHENQFREIAESMSGYDLTLCGKMVFPHD